MPKWFITPGLKPAMLWQIPHDCVVGRWLAGIGVPVADVKVDVEVWQASHGAPLGSIWLIGFETGVTPLKLCPLWQLAQPLTMPVWLNTACSQPMVVVWQLSHEPVEGTCPLDLPVAVVPLWQVRQEPGATPT